MSANKSPPPASPVKASPHFFLCSVIPKGQLAAQWPGLDGATTIPYAIGKLNAADDGNSSLKELELNLKDIKQQAQQHLVKFAQAQGADSLVKDRDLQVELATGIERAPFFGVLSTPFCSSAAELRKRLGPTTVLEAFVSFKDDDTEINTLGDNLLVQAQLTSTAQPATVAIKEWSTTVRRDADVRSLRRRIERTFRDFFGLKDSQEVSLLFKRPRSAALRQLSKHGSRRSFDLAVAEAVADQQPLVLEMRVKGALADNDATSQKVHQAPSTSAPEADTASVASDASSIDIGAFQAAVAQSVASSVSSLVEGMQKKIGDTLKDHLAHLTEALSDAAVTVDEARSKLSSNTATPTSSSSTQGVVHNAYCDLCSQSIKGTRRKCAVCPDWDCCESCAPRLHEVHPGHGFFVSADPRAFPSVNSAPRVRHPNVICDGCGINIHGMRYKCIACNFDLCGNCEADPLENHAAMRGEQHLLLKVPRPMSTPGAWFQCNRMAQDFARARGGMHHHGRCRKPFQAPTDGSAAEMTTGTAEKPADNVAKPAPEKDTEPQMVQKDSSASPIAPVSTPPNKLAASSVLVPVNDKSTLELVEEGAPANGAALPAGCQFNKTWKIRNMGAFATAPLHIAHTAGDAFMAKTTIINGGRPIQPGQTVQVMLEGLVAPKSKGRHSALFKVKNAEGQQDSAVGLWLDINVVATDEAAEETRSGSTSSILVAPEPSTAARLVDVIHQSGDAESTATTSKPPSEVDYGGLRTPSTEDGFVFIEDDSSNDSD